MITLSKINKENFLNIETISYYSLLLMAFALPLSRAAISFFLVWFFILVLLKRDYKSSFNILKENKIFLYLALFFGYIILSLLWSEDYASAWRHIRLYGYWIIVPCIVILAKKEWLYKILNAFLLGMFLSEILSYGIFFDLWSFNGRTSEYPTPFMTHIHYSIFLAFTSLVLLYRFLFENASLRFKISLFLFFCLTTTNLMISTGRLGQLAFFITLFFVFIMRYKVSIKSILLASLLMISIAFISYNGLDLFKKRIDAGFSDVEKISNKDYDNSFGIRASWWVITYDALKEKPLFGYGIGSHKVAAKKMIEKYQYSGLTERLKSYLSSSHYHNQYLMIIVEGGIIGLFLFFLFIYKVYRLKIDDIEMKHISIIGITVCLIGFIAEPLLFLQFPLMLFLFILTLSIIASKDNKKEI